MIVSDLSPQELSCRLGSEGLHLRTGPFTVHLHSQVGDLASPLHRLYGNHPLLENPEFSDFHVHLTRARGLRARWRSWVRFWYDGHSPFDPLPESLLWPHVEWGLNWCIAVRAHQYLMLHAGGVERYGRALLLPAWPGSGKSTLCAALSQRGWRLLSDEFALVRPRDLAVVPLARPIGLKNESIQVIRRFAPEVVLGPAFPKTRKGTVAHVRPTAESVARAGEVARPGLIVFPQYQAGAEPQLLPLVKERAFLRLTGNSFNYERIGLRGFETAAALIDGCDSYTFRYGNLEQAVALLDGLMQQAVSRELTGFDEAFFPNGATAVSAPRLRYHLT